MTSDQLLELVRRPLPVGAVATWAAISVVAVVILVRLRENHFGWKVGAALFAVGAASVVLLCSAARGERPEYRHVPDVMANVKSYHARGTVLYVYGFVVTDSILQRKGADEYRFQIANERGGPWVLNARYTGLVPDTFRSGMEIVVKGTLAADGWLDVVPDSINANCPTKYGPSIERSGPRQCVW